jgi:hypothetical protein
MQVNATAQIRLGASVPSTPTRINRRLVAGFFIGLLVAASLALVVANHDGFTFASNPSTGSPGTGAPMVSARDPLKWPFSRDSIWNIPIGANANYVWGNIARSTAAGGLQVDPDVIILTPNAPVTPWYYNADAWNGGTRCAAQGGALFNAPIPTDFVIPGANMGSPDGSTPNYATAILGADGHTLYQGQPSARCTVGGTATMWWVQHNEDLYGTGVTGAHGGSSLSSVGGTIRLGELVPSGIIRHALKVNFDSPNLYPGAPRWPAPTRDACAPGCYQSTNPALRMGALLGLQPNYNFAQLETEPGRIIAHAFQDYGGYSVDHAGWSVYGLSVEFGPAGHVSNEFRTSWGYELNPPNKNTPWARDIDRIFTNLAVVDNWDYATWQTASASKGGLGAGLGAPRVPWAPDFGQTPPPPPSTVGTTLTLTTAKNPSTVNETISVGGRLADATGALISGHSVALEWSADQVTWLRESQIGQFPPTDANGAFSGKMAFRGSIVHTEYIRARFAGDSTYSASSSPVVAQGVIVPPPSPLQVSATLSGTAGANGWYVSNVTVGLSTSGTAGVTTIVYSIDNGPSTTYRQSLAFQQGRHALMFQGSNASGYFGPAQYGTFDVDWTPPTVGPVYDHITMRKDAPLTWIGSDSVSGIARYDVSVDGGSFQSAGSEPRLAGSWTIGSHTAVVRAYDEAGNSAMTSFPFQVDEDAAAVPPVQLAPAPAVPSITLPIVTLLGLTSLVLSGAAALMYRRVRSQTTSAKKGRKPAQRTRKPRREDSFDNSDDYLDCPM